MVNLAISHWEEAQAWTTFTGYHPRDLERRLTRFTGQPRAAIKRLARRLKSRECFTLPLPGATDSLAATSLRNFLESLGAAIQITET